MSAGALAKGDAMSSSNLVTKADLRAEVARLESRISETKVTMLLAFFGGLGVLFGLLEVFP